MLVKKRRIKVFVQSHKQMLSYLLTLPIVKVNDYTKVTNFKQESSVKSPTKANTDLHDGDIILTNKTSTSDPL